MVSACLNMSSILKCSLDLRPLKSPHVFHLVEPQSRVDSESHSNSLLAQIATQRQIVTNRYLAFFQERRSIEATYIDSLRKLHRKAKTVDASSDPRAEPTTTRTAWDKLRDNLEKEANTQQAFVDILDNDVIKPLESLKETKAQRGKQIEEDLKESAAKYADYAENTVSKLQEAYSKKKSHPQHSTDVPRRSQGAANKGFGSKFSALFRRREESRAPEPARSEEVSDDDCRRATRLLNGLRLNRAEILKDGYDCLEDLVFKATVKNVLAKYMDGMVVACVKYDNLAMSTRAEVEKALAGTDTSGLIASFRHSLSISIPPLALYCNHRPDAYSDLIFGVPLVDLTTNEDNVPKVMRMCIEEVEKKGLNTHKIYSFGSIYDAEILQLRRKLETEKSFSFSSTGNIHSVAMLLKLYLWDLPEPLFTLSLEDYRQYKQNRARYTENDYSMLRSKIRELHSVHRVSLEALLRHLLRVASHSDVNAMTVKALATQFSYPVLRGNEVLQDGVHVKSLVLEDLIQNAHTLFDEGPSLSPSPDVTETASTLISSSFFLSPELPRSSVVQADDSTTRLCPELGGTPTSSQYSFPTSPSHDSWGGPSH
ncbi:Rho GTPase activation protein [Lactarius akahatsu]|uniref:Rho GTPase activation protein n=1 Tax=Lactarius akahatsu TaxID=416441 RepID=A0AAD4Q7E1_9AGAM|nr:Rho GTPase activation protein [Lactarius akahatsu]